MDTLHATVEEIRSTLDQLRQNPQTKRRFPKELWNSIIQLTKNYSLNDICSQLDIHPVYLKQKIRQTREDKLEFHEVSLAMPVTSNSEVKIELSSKSGLKALIQGPTSCLDCLQKLFGG
jgi:transposase-like protein